MDEYVHEDITMLIIGDHPHAGELCNPIGSTLNTITPFRLFGEIHYKVNLINCPHLTDGCFVGKDSLQLVSGGRR